MVHPFARVPSAQTSLLLATTTAVALEDAETVGVAAADAVGSATVADAAGVAADVAVAAASATVEGVAVVAAGAGVAAAAGARLPIAGALGIFRAAR